jgi:hypothetical protein
MGKFPGKPSKIVNKKRVKASKCSQFQENDSVKAAENIYFGLAVFNEAFGSEQVGLYQLWHEAIMLQRF